MFPQIMLYAVVLFLFVSNAVTSARAEWQGDDNRPTRSSLAAIVEWLSANAELALTRELPTVELVPSPELTRLRDKGLSSFYAGGGPAAVYDDASRTIYLPKTWTGKSPVEQSVLVHEMVHHMQNQAGMRYACDDARAEPAYLAQDKWLQQHGLSLTKEFQIDRFTIDVLATCM